MLNKNSNLKKGECMSDVREIPVGDEQEAGTELTREQLKRQDFVDNAINNLIQELLPESAKKELFLAGGDLHRWDIEMIGVVRDAIEAEFVKSGYCTEQEFYPYIE